MLDILLDRIDFRDKSFSMNYRSKYGKEAEEWYVKTVEALIKK
jgi:hypothetical protein